MLFAWAVDVVNVLIIYNGSGRDTLVLMQLTSELYRSGLFRLFYFNLGTSVVVVLEVFIPEELVFWQFFVLLLSISGHFSMIKVTVKSIFFRVLVFLLVDCLN